jgi:hypothetical protein
MRSLRRGSLPLSSVVKAARLCVIGCAFVVSGCAANKQPAYVAGPSPYIGVPAPMPSPRGAQVAAAVKSKAKIEIEDDGLPVQSPPPARIRDEPDDPSEPFSPNYGGPRAPAPATTPVPRKSVQSARLSDSQADALIRRAIAAHEMRHQ